MDSNLDFKSCDPNFQHANTFLAYIEHAFENQCHFDKNTTPCEMNYWNYEDLQAFEIDVDKIDRMYHVYEENHWDYEFIIRMQFDGKPLYVELFGWGFQWLAVGHIYLSRNVDMFMKCVLGSNPYRDTSKYNVKAIYELLKEDGIYLEEGSCAPTLQQLCYATISNNIATLQEYKTELPKMLTENVNYFIKTEEAIKHYNKCLESLVQLINL